jgi:predicted aldo/keto reductase-like oxidoreductase
MGSESGLTRRGFLTTAATATAAGLILGGATLNARGEEAAGAAEAMPKVPRRRFGRTGIEVSAIAGNETISDPALVEAALDAGINYWHKAGSYLLPALKKYGREKAYVEICLDPSGSADKDVENFKSAIRGGFEYGDFFKMHGSYSEASAEAFHKLKDEGLVKHLSASFHGCGDAVAALKKGDLEAIQVSASPVSGSELTDLLKAAKEAEVGVILMKTMMGGPDGWKGDALKKALLPYTERGMSIPDAIVAACLAMDGVSSLVIATGSLDKLTASIKAANTEPAKAAAMESTAASQREFCAVCGKCSGVCPQGVAVQEIMRADMYARGYREGARAQRLYSGLSHRQRALSCSGCGSCARACPYGVASPERISAAGQLLA